MKIAFCTNIWNHHQGPVAIELARLLGEDFRLLLHQPLDHKYSKERIALGWELTPPDVGWIVGPPKSEAEANYGEYRRIAIGADVLLLDGMPPYLDYRILAWRHRQGKINLMMVERFFKQGIPWYWTFWPRKIVLRWIVCRRFRAAGIHFLTMSHWCKDDLAYYWVSQRNIWRWGYLTAVSADCPKKKINERIRIGWCGRMIDWKQVDLIVRAFAGLPIDVQKRCLLKLAGDGDQKSRLVQLANECGISERVEFLHSMPHSEAIRFLGDLDIFVFPSNRKEGWGATLLEAMDQGCAVIASEAAGATLEVVEDGRCGLTFRDRNVEDLMKKLEWLILHGEERRKLGSVAWEKVQKWSPAEGAYRLVNLTRGLFEKRSDMIPDDGLCANVR